MTDTVQIGILNDQYDINTSGGSYQLAFGQYILQTKAGFAGIKEAFGVYDNKIQVDGSIGSATGVGIEIDGFNSTLTIGASGTIDARAAIVAYEDSVHITNDGKLTGDVEIVTSADSSFINNGTLHGKFISSRSDNGTVEFGGDSTVTADEAIKIFSDTGKTTHVTNYGAVTGTEFAFSSDQGDETLVNRGTIEGKISFGAGNDTFDNRLGSVDHVIEGGAGNDTFIVDKKIAISELAGEGRDTIKSTIDMNLSTGVLSHQSLENLRLIGTGDIDGTGNGLANTIVGNAQANRLSGLGGGDLLSGGKGKDVLDGGVGDDTLSGGLGADTFVFKTGYGHDVIKDFDSSADHIDLKAWHGIADFKDMVSHHLTVSGDNLVIHAGADELVLQHTTKNELHASDFSF